MPVHSLGARLALVASVVLAAFLGLAGIALDRAFRASAEQAAPEPGSTADLLARAERVLAEAGDREDAHRERELAAREPAGLGVQYKFNRYRYQRGILSSDPAGEITYKGFQLYLSFLF